MSVEPIGCSCVLFMMLLVVYDVFFLDIMNIHQVFHTYMMKMYYYFGRMFVIAYCRSIKDGKPIHWNIDQ